MRKPQSVVTICLLVSLLALSGCSSKYWGWTETGTSTFKAMLSQFWSNVRPVKDLAVSHYKLGRFYQQRGQYQKAIIEFKKAVHSDPEYVTAYNALAMAYDAVSDYENAELVYNKAIFLNPKLAYLYNNLGYSYLCRGDHDAAVKYFEKAANLDGKKSRINNNLQLARSKSIENKQSQEQEFIIASTNESVDEFLETQTAEVESIVNEQTNVKADNAFDPSELKQAESEVPEDSSLQQAAETGFERLNIVKNEIDSPPSVNNDHTPETNQASSDMAMTASESQEVIVVEPIEVAATIETQTAEVESIVNEQMNVKADNAFDPSELKQAESEVPEDSSLQQAAETGFERLNIVKNEIDSPPSVNNGHTPETNQASSDMAMTASEYQEVIVVEPIEVAATINTEIVNVEGNVNDIVDEEVKAIDVSNPSELKQAESEVPEDSSLQRAAETGFERFNIVKNEIDSPPSMNNDHTPETSQASSDMAMTASESQEVIVVEPIEVASAIQTQTSEVESIVNDRTNVKADKESDPSESKQAETETQKSYTIQLVANTYSSSSNIRSSVIDSAPIGYYGLKPRVNTEQSSKGTNEKQSQKEKGIRSVGIEVVNGNGVKGMARRTAGYLEKKGLKVYKISNAQHFGFNKTKILYKNGSLQEAYIVAKLIPGYQDFAKLNSLSSSNLHVQVLLGRDTISSQHILR